MIPVLFDRIINLCNQSSLYIITVKCSNKEDIVLEQCPNRQWVMKSSLWTVIFSSVHCVFGLRNLNFFGEYVGFAPSTTAIKFDLQRDMDFLLLESDANETASSEYLYRVMLVLTEMGSPDSVDQTDKVSREYGIDFKIFKEGRTMLAGNYPLWDISEKDNIMIDWGSKQNAIQALTDVDGDQHSIFSWKDRSKIIRSVRHLGIRAADGAGLENQHSKWKLKEASAKDFDISKSTRICDIKLLPDHPRSNPTPIYEIFITREQDESYRVSAQKNSVEMARAKASRVDTDNVYVSWDYDFGVIMVGVRGDPMPLLLCQDTRWKRKDFERVQFVTYEGLGRDMVVDRIRNISAVPKLFHELAVANKELAVDDRLSEK